MSSIAAPEGGVPLRRSSPPQAPSAKMARDLGGEPQPYRPPALRNGALAVGDDVQQVDSVSAYGAGYRRARAGTLPSNLSSTSAAPAPLSAAAPGGAAIVNSQPANIALNPALRQVMNSNSPGRARSGSLTLPSSGLNGAFGPNIFSSNYGRQVAPGSRPMLEGMTRVYSNDSLENEALGKGVLDYLGLADTPRAAPTYPQQSPLPATLSELKAQAQQQVISRSRASTVSSPYRQVRATQSNTMLPDTGEDELEYIDGLSYTGSSPSVHTPASQTPPNAFKKASHLLPSSRPRATSVGTLLDSPTTRHNAVHAPGNLLNDDDAMAQQLAQQLNISGGGATYTSQNLQPSTLQRPTSLLDQHRSETNVPSYFQQQQQQHLQQQQQLLQKTLHSRTGSLSTANTPRAHTPDTHKVPLAPTQLPPLSMPGNQIPSRSLWLGNLDSAVTTQELMRVFHVYGAIESLRLLPDKECGFVNFVDKADAVRAMDDVRNRLGGRISTLGEGKPVRVGFGKVDSVPLGPGSVTSPTETGPGGVTNENQSAPTRALWVGSIPANTTPAKLLSIFSPYGPIESVRVLTHKNCGFINFERIDSAIVARKSLNGRDVLGPEVGSVRIGFARVPVKASSPERHHAPGIGGMSVAESIDALRHIKGAADIPADAQVLGGTLDDYRSNLVLGLVQSGELGNITREAAQNDPVSWAASVTEQQMVMRVISAGDPSAEADILALAEFSPPTTYYTMIAQVPDRSGLPRRYDVSALRETKKRLDTLDGQAAQFDEVAHELMEDAAELSSDHVGNTVIQKLYVHCSPQVRLMLLERIAPHLATIGVHKNGTWAAQKIIECASSAEEVAIIAQNIQPFVPPLLLDQYGNYVVSICLRFGAPRTDFIFDAIVARLWDIAQGRFGARSIRTCLDSSNTTPSQRRKVAVNIILNSIPLVTSPNGALLVTWLLDSSMLPGRFDLLASRFEPHLAHLCTHKLASAAVMRIVNQVESLEASRSMLRGLFLSPNDDVLTDVLRDQIHGVSVVQKILASPMVEEDKQAYLEPTIRVLEKLNVSTSQTYRRILEDVGLPFVAPPPSDSSYGAGFPAHQQFAPPSSYAPYGMPMGYDNSSLMMGMNSLASEGWVSPMPAHLPPLLVAGQHMDHFRNTTAAFSPTSDPFNPFASPPRQESRLPGGGFRRSSARSGGGSGRSTPQHRHHANHDNGYIAMPPQPVWRRSGPQYAPAP